jgi:hypothetical protein
MRTRKLTPYCLAALLAGCVPIVSLHPLCTKETIAFEEKLLGTWVEDANQPEVTWEFAHLESGAARLLPAELRDALDKWYRLSITDKDGRRGSFAACLVKLQDKLFLDVVPDRFPSGEQDPEQMRLVYNAFFFTPVHSFVRVSSIGAQLKIRLTDDDGFKKLVQADPKVVKHDMIDDRPILTASTEELQTFVAKYADDERLFPSEVILIRKSK